MTNHDKPKALSDIDAQLKANAVVYPETSYPKAPPRRLIKDKQLRRLKYENQWKYIKYG